MGWSAEGVVSQVLHQLETYTAALLCAIGFLTGAGAMLYGAAVVDVMREKKRAILRRPIKRRPTTSPGAARETKRPHITECQHCERQSSKMFFRGFSLN
jgi:hypothetical protein